MLPPHETEFEKYFSRFRENIIGIDQCFTSPFGQKRIIYADWAATGRAYGPIECCLQQEIMPYLANTHSKSSHTGTLMTLAYQEAKKIVKDHVHATSDDALIFCGSGMTAAVNKLQRLLGLRMPERCKDYFSIERLKTTQGTSKAELRPVVFTTRMEHHSNHTSWLETLAHVELIACDSEGNVDLTSLGKLLRKYRNSTLKIAAVTACSNVTGIETQYHEIAKIMHANGGYCFVDFSASAPYTEINMNPAFPEENLDAIYFSPHKFLGGPGTPGVLVFKKFLYTNRIPDHPGGGTMMYSNPWNAHDYLDDIEEREDGGTPPILQGIKVGMCIRLKDEMGVQNIRNREQEIVAGMIARLLKMKTVHVLAKHAIDRHGVFSFIIPGAHYNMITRLLNDRFGIQTRSGCSCASTYGHMLLQITKKSSLQIRDLLKAGNLGAKPGWVRVSIHATMTTGEISYILDAIESTANWFSVWQKDYEYDPHTNEFSFPGYKSTEQATTTDWFTVSRWENINQGDSNSCKTQQLMTN